MDLFPETGETPPGRPEADGLARLEERIDRALSLAGVAPDGVDLRPALSDRVAYWVARGNLIWAIKAHREETGVGLKEAKEAVEGGGTVPLLERLERKLDVLLARLAAAADEDEADGGGESPDGASLDDLLRQERVIEAIVVYRRQTGAGLARAKEAVEARLEELRAAQGAAKAR